MAEDMQPTSVTLDDISGAAKAMKDQVIRTPTVHAARLSLRTGIDLWLKLENLQHTAAFKARGALYKLMNLSDAEKRAGVIACSAGNHAQGVAYHASHLGIPAVIVMPRGTPFNKIQRTQEFGAKVVLEGENLSEAMAHTRDLIDAHGYTFVHPFDDDVVIAGQGTCGLEMIEQEPDLDCIVVPVGGGGLIAGTAIAAKAIKPDIEIIGVQAELHAGVKENLEGYYTPHEGPTIAEGIAVKSPARRTMDIISQYVDRIETVSEDEIEDAVFTYLSSEKMVVEGAAGAGLAAVLKHKDYFRGRKVGLIVCGGNIDSRMLSTLIMRGMVREGRIARLRFEIDDTPGQLADISRIIGEENANVIEVIHQRMMQAVPLKRAELDIVMEARDSQHIEEIITRLREHGFRLSRMNEMS